ncbi:MAG TPA: stage III sporulation protein AD [Pseudogracilibacillus sp.]|nr:stage III sporulation protein AD [Pseudogracilibacillus sp.]
MDMIQIISLAMIASLFYLLLKEVVPAFAFATMLITAIYILFVILSEMVHVLQLLRNLANKVAIQSIYLDTIIKIIGIAYVTELGANVTKDAGLSSVSTKIELAGKVFILLLAIPIIEAVMEVILQFAPTSNTFLND